jgi:hypothetical protein
MSFIQTLDHGRSPFLFFWNACSTVFFLDFYPLSLSPFSPLQQKIFKNS